MEYLTLKDRFEYALTCKKNFNEHFIRIVRARKNKQIFKYLSSEIEFSECENCEKIYCEDCEQPRCEQCNLLDCCCSCIQCSNCGDLVSKDLISTCQMCEDTYCIDCGDWKVRNGNVICSECFEK